MRKLSMISMCMRLLFLKMASSTGARVQNSRGTVCIAGCCHVFNVATRKGMTKLPESFIHPDGQLKWIENQVT